MEYPRDPIDKIPEYLKCPICFEVPRNKVFQCKDGHTICAQCHSRVTHCPQCRIPFGKEPIRTLIIEKMLDEFKVECPYKKSGCTFKSTRTSFHEHVQSCIYNTAKFGPFINVCERIGYLNCIFKMNRGNTRQAIQHFKKRHYASVYESDSLEIQFSDFAKISTKNRRTWTPIILNRNEEGNAFLILAVFKDQKSLGWVPLHMPYPSGVDLGKSQPSKPYPVECSIIGEHSLAWRISPINVLQVGEFPLGFIMPVTQVVDSPSRNLLARITLCKNGSGESHERDTSGPDENSLSLVPSDFSATPMEYSEHKNSKPGSTATAQTKVGKKMVNKKNWKSCLDLDLRK